MLNVTLPGNPKQNSFILQRRWPWHVLFWLGYILFRFQPYYLTLKFYPPVFLQYMLLSEIMFVVTTYFTLWLYRMLFREKRILVYFCVGATGWLLYLLGRTVFQIDYLKDDPGFQGNSLTAIFLNNIAIVLAGFLFITACKYFKDSYIAQQRALEGKQQQLIAEVDNLKSQIAPHFLFNTLNNLYGLAVEKSDKLPDLMLRLSDILRHSLYETQKAFVLLTDEIKIVRSYVALESIRLEDDLQLEFNDEVPGDSPHRIAPLLLIVFIENAFKHARLVRSSAVTIEVQTSLENDWFTMSIRNNYNRLAESSANGIGLLNVKRRLELLYPDNKHVLTIDKNDAFFTVNLRLQLV